MADNKKKILKMLETNCYKIKKQILKVESLWYVEKNELPTAAEMQDALKIIKSLVVTSQLLTNVFESGHQDLAESKYILPRLKRMCNEIKSSESEAGKLNTQSIHELSIRISSAERNNLFKEKLKLMGSPEYTKIKADFRRVDNIICQASQLAEDVAMYIRNA